MWFHAGTHHKSAWILWDCVIMTREDLEGRASLRALEVLKRVPGIKQVA